MGFKMKKGSGTANANTEGAFSSKDNDTMKNLSKSAFDVDAPVDPSFKSDAGEVIATVRKVTSKPISFKDAGYGIKPPTIRDIEGKPFTRGEAYDIQEKLMKSGKIAGSSPSAIKEKITTFKFGK
jgi:hypothetical protein